MCLKIEIGVCLCVVVVVLCFCRFVFLFCLCVIVVFCAWCELVIEGVRDLNLLEMMCVEFGLLN